MKRSLDDAMKAHRAPAAPADSSSEADARRPPSRRGRKAVTIYLDPAARRQLRALALDEETSVRGFVETALDDLFETKGKPRIAAARSEGMANEGNVDLMATAIRTMNRRR